MNAVEQLRLEAGRNPRPKKGGYPITDKQLRALIAIASVQRRDVQGECVSLFGVKPVELSKKAASAFISYLRAEPRNGG